MPASCFLRRLLDVLLLSVRARARAVFWNGFCYAVCHLRAAFLERLLNELLLTCALSLGTAFDVLLLRCALILGTAFDVLPCSRASLLERIAGVLLCTCVHVDSVSISCVCRAMLVQWFADRPMPARRTRSLGRAAVVKAHLHRCIPVVVSPDAKLFWRCAFINNLCGSVVRDDGSQRPMSQKLSQC